MSSKVAFGSRTNAYVFDPDELVIITEKDHALYDPRVELPLDEALVKSIMHQGVIEPIVITKMGESPVVVDGRQRVRCAQEANRRLKDMGKETVKITGVIRRGGEADLLGVSITANDIRQDDSPLVKARKCARYMAMGRSEDEAAVTFGVTRQAISSWLKLLECSAPVRKAIDDGKLSASAATKLASLEPDEQKAALEELLSTSNGKRPTAKKAAKAAKKRGGKVDSGKKGVKEIRAKIEEVGLPTGWRPALRWVLGEE